ncbi:MAG: hypothetical protein LBU85_06220 [Treponema sp.]|jgi:hypothetical protein|nr:hypothetical protein [Treponema sp.]
MSRLKDILIGKTISKIIPIEDYLQIFFADGSILNLNNKTTFSHQFQHFYNETINDLIITNDVICIKANDKEIAMSMKEEDYYSPEAFEFCSENEEWIVG